RRAEHPNRLRPIPLLVIRPSIDLASMASDQFRRLPALLRHLARGIGACDQRGADLMSYLAFDPSYTRPLLELGRSDSWHGGTRWKPSFFPREPERLQSTRLRRAASATTHSATDSPRKRSSIRHAHARREPAREQLRGLGHHLREDLRRRPLLRQQTGRLT